ncbi:hypothetical protein JCM3766R1_006376 [Sporobolomyces carnicolor]
MPARKKVVAAASTDPGRASEVEDDATPSANGIDQFELPKSVIARLAKSSVPPEVKLQKEVPLALVKGSTVFISYLAALSHDLAQEKNQKTITAVHVLEAVRQLGWDESSSAGGGGGGVKSGRFEKELKRELKAFRRIVESKKNGTYVPAAKKQQPSRPGAPSGAAETTEGGEGGGRPDEEEAERGGTSGAGRAGEDSASEDEAMALEEGIELYEEDEEEAADEADGRGEDDDVDDGVAEPVGAIDKVNLDDVDDEDDVDEDVAR